MTWKSAIEIKSLLLSRIGSKMNQLLNYTGPTCLTEGSGSLLFCFVLSDLFQ